MSSHLVIPRRSLPSSIPPRIQECITGSVGELSDIELDIICNSPTKHIGEILLLVASVQRTIPRAILWLAVVSEVECVSAKSARLCSALLSYASSSKVPYKRDESALSVSLAEEKVHWYDFDATHLPVVSSPSFVLDPGGSLAHRSLVRTLLSGSLSKNSKSVLYRSFFSSSMREVHLLPLIARYLNPANPEEHLGIDDSVAWAEVVDLHRCVDSLVTLSLLLCLEDVPFVSEIVFIISERDEFVWLLSSELHRFDRVECLSFSSAFKTNATLDLSFLEQADTSRVTSLDFKTLVIPSLSPLSRCNLSSLETLNIQVNQHERGFDSLDGLTSSNTASLQQLCIRSIDLVDISALSTCNLSSLRVLLISICADLVDISALSACDLSSLRSLSIEMCGKLTSIPALSSCSRLSSLD